MMRILIFTFFIYVSKVPLDQDPYLFHIRLKSPVRPDWRCRGCVVIIIIMTVGDAEDAR